MTPKEKAEELINVYYPIVNGGEQYNWVFKKSKECALIAVDEIINSNPYKVSLEGKFLTEHIKYDINFWQEVKQEIEKL